MKPRRKISTVKNDFLSELRRLKTFDSENQIKYSSARPTLTKKEICLLTESIFFASFREYENFVRDIFLLYSQGTYFCGRKKVVSYLQPKGFIHAEKLIQSSMPFLDWNNPDTIINRSELYLEDGFPIKIPYTSNLTALQAYKKIRNHIAHNSSASFESYIKVLKNYYGTIPLKIPKPGEFLLETDKVKPSNYNLLSFFNLIENIANGIVP